MFLPIVKDVDTEGKLLNLTNGEFGSYYSIATILSAISLIWAGKLIDNIELRKYVVAIVIGLSLTCLLVSSIINVYMLFISLYFLRLFGQGLMGHTSRTTMARYFDKDRGKALAVSSYGLAFGEIFYPIMAVLLIGLIGWRFTWLVSSIFIIIFFGMGLWYILRNHSQIHQNFLNTQKVQEGISWKRRDILKDIKKNSTFTNHTLNAFCSNGIFFSSSAYSTPKRLGSKFNSYGFNFLCCIFNYWFNCCRTIG